MLLDSLENIYQVEWLYQSRDDANVILPSSCIEHPFLGKLLNEIDFALNCKRGNAGVYHCYDHIPPVRMEYTTTDPMWDVFKLDIGCLTWAG